MPKKRLTDKESKLVSARAAGKTISEAAKEAGYLPNATDETRRVEATRTLQKPHVKEALDKALDIGLARRNITLDRALAPIDKGLDATKQNEYTGEITEDLKLQLQASDRALKLMGVYNQQDGKVSNTFIQVINESKDRYV